MIGEKLFHCLKFEKVGFCITFWIGIVDIAYSKRCTANPGYLMIESRIVGASSLRIQSYLASISWLSKERKLK